MTLKIMMDKITNRLIRQHGFCVDTSKSITFNKMERLKELPSWFYFTMPSNLSFYDLTDDRSHKYTHLRSLLGLGTKFIPIIKGFHYKPPLQKTFERLEKDLTTKIFMAGTVNTGEFNPYLHET